MPMNFLSWRVYLGLSLIGLSFFLYALNYLVFQDWHYMSRLFLGQLCFLPISVLLVTLIVNQLLSHRAKRAKLEKLNMVIGAFYSDVGVVLLKLLSGYDQGLNDFRKEIAGLQIWSDSDFNNFKKQLPGFNYQIEIKEDNLLILRDFLTRKKDLMLRLLENPNLLEHDSFSNFLLAVFHLEEELEHRKEIKRLSPADREHLAEDVKRAYIGLIREWLGYMQHLKNNYPYLFSLALRTNPFDAQASVALP